MSSRRHVPSRTVPGERPGATRSSGRRTRRSVAAVPVAATFLAVLLGWTGSAPAPDRASGAPEPGSAYPGTYAFVDVHVVPMDRWRILEHQTVLVRDGAIREIGDTGSVAVPPDATRIPGDGRYLLPGLGDMHVRLPGADAPDGWVEDALFLYVANGVTVVRQAEGRSGHLALKRRLLSERTLGPTLYTASPPFDVGGPVSAGALQGEIRRVARQGWDHLRMPENVDRSEWDRIADASSEIGVPFGGPVPRRVGLRHAIANDLSTVDGLDPFVEAAVADELRQRRQLADTAENGDDENENGGDLRIPGDPRTLARTVDRTRIRAVTGRARSAGVWVSPTLHLWETLHRPEATDSLLDGPEMRYVPSEVRRRWNAEARRVPRYDTETVRRLAEGRRAVVKELNDVAGGVLLATGSPGPFSVPGFSIHREMRLMEEAGLTPYEVLIAGTRNAARYASGVLGESGRFGTVAEGNRADLILVEENPLEDLGSLERPAGVMVRGRWLPADEIEERLEQIARRRGG